MSQTAHTSALYRQLEAYRESWRSDHDAAMRCRDWEECIAVGIGICRLLREQEELWRDRVFRGTLPEDAQDDRDQRERFALWLSINEPILRDVIPALERQFGRVDGAEHLREWTASVKQTLADWQPARLSAAVGLREMSLSPEAATQLDRLVAEAKDRPQDTPSLSRMVELSAADFLQLKRSGQA